MLLVASYNNRDNVFRHLRCYAQPMTELRIRFFIRPQSVSRVRRFDRTTHEPVLRSQKKKVLREAQKSWSRCSRAQSHVIQTGIDLRHFTRALFVPALRSAGFARFCHPINWPRRHWNTSLTNGFAKRSPNCSLASTFRTCMLEFRWCLAVTWN